MFCVSTLTRSSKLDAVDKDKRFWLKYLKNKTKHQNPISSINLCLNTHGRLDIAIFDHAQQDKIRWLTNNRKFVSYVTTYYVVTYVNPIMD